MAFVTRELMSPDHGFYCALDADSEGEEGRFYVWSKSEIKEIIGEDAELICRYYDVTEKGNWEGHNVLNIPLALKSLRRKGKLTRVY